MDLTKAVHQFREDCEQVLAGIESQREPNKEEVSTIEFYCKQLFKTIKRYLPPKSSDADLSIPAHILVVDDDPLLLTALEVLLAGPNRIIVKAESGQDALRHLLREDFAVILLDVRMPQLDGYETAALIRQRERSRYTPII
ncbi:MAG TPA: response regulator, partial [Nitrospira sp.]|nr:response regulator [Nitrospira sp.]